MTVADPIEIGCEWCGAEPGEVCRTSKGKTLWVLHAIRWADSQLDEAEPGWIPSPGEAVVLDFVAARMLKIARGNGVDL